MDKNFSRSIFLSAALAGLTGPAAAAGFGSMAALLMAEGQAVRPLGQGGAWAARAEGEAALPANPAGLSAQEGLSIGGGQVLGLLDDRVTWLDAAAALGEGWAVGLQAAYQSSEDTVRDAFGNVGDTFSDRQDLLGLSVAGEPLPGWRLGLGVKGLSESNGGQVDQAVAADLGLQGPWGGERRWGLAVLNAGGQLPAAGSPGLPTPLRVQLGAASPVLTPDWQLEADLQSLPNEGQARALVGTELGFSLGDDPSTGPWRGSLRAGAQWGLLLSEDPVLSLGAGVSAPGRWDVDYALQSVGALGLTHRFGATLRFQARVTPHGGPLTAPYGLTVLRQFDGLQVSWLDDNAKVAGYNLYSDYGVLAERINAAPVAGKSQKLVKVTPSRTYNFYVRAVGLDGKEGPPSEIRVVALP